MSGRDGSSGNGVDLAAIYGAILALDRKLDRGLAELRAELATKSDKADLAALRSEVASYHGSVVGHGILISELEERVGRLECGEPPKAA